MQAKNLKWILYISLILIWGTSFILIKKSLLYFTPIQVGSLRIIITFLALLPLALHRLKQLKKRDWLIIGLNGFLGSFFPAYLFALAQTGLNSATAGILNSLTPLFTLLVGIGLFQLKAKWWSFAGVFISMLGTYGLLSISGGNAFELNIRYGVLIILATLFYGTQINILKKIPQPCSSCYHYGFPIFYYRLACICSFIWFYRLCLFGKNRTQSIRRFIFCGHTGPGSHCFCPDVV